MKGLNIGKKIVRVLGKQFKAKVMRPINSMPYENDKDKENENENITSFNFKGKFYDHNSNFSNDISIANNSSSINISNFEENKFQIFKKFANLNSNYMMLNYIILNNNTKSSSLLNKKNFGKIFNFSKKKIYLGCSLKQFSRGMKVVAVKKGSPAEKADLRANDVIIRVGNKEVNSIEDFNKWINSSNSMVRNLSRMTVCRNENGRENLINLKF